jgi:hypothetical protein
MDIVKSHGNFVPFIAMLITFRGTKLIYHNKRRIGLNKVFDNK